MSVGHHTQHERRLNSSFELALNYLSWQLAKFYDFVCLPVFFHAAKKVHLKAMMTFCLNANSRIMTGSF